MMLLLYLGEPTPYQCGMHYTVQDYSPAAVLSECYCLRGTVGSRQGQVATWTALNFTVDVIMSCLN
jgi:hypothetical protein